jgi:hypothetical protein
MRLKEDAMPFAGEFREAMGFPRAGDIVGGFVIQELSVRHEGMGAGRYEYPIELVLAGKGGKEGVRRALKGLFSRRMTLFTEFGNPYQCSVGSIAVEGLGEGLYRVTARGIGNRVHLREELIRFMGYLGASGAPGPAADPTDAGRIADEYMRRYWNETRTPGGGWWPAE